MEKEILEIEKVIDEKVRPALLDHEGNVKLLSYENGICKVRLLGKCSNCPSAKLTTEELIGKQIMETLPYVRDVVLVDEVSPELLLFARQILNHEVAV